MSERNDRQHGERRGGRPERDRRQEGPRRNAKGHERNRRAQAERSYSSSAPGRRTRRADPARLAAFETLRAVSEEGAYGNLVLPKLIRAHRLDRRDAGFATELAYGALRWQGTYDAVLARCVDRPLADLDGAVLDALRLGVHQLLAMRVPDHAALDQTVGLVRAEIGAGPGGLVNAVLRKVAARDLAAWVAQLTADAPDDAARLGLAHAHPAWEVRALRQALTAHGRDAAELEALLAADNAAPVVNLVALPGLGELAEALETGAEPGPLVPGSALSSGGDLHRLDSVRGGGVRVQDAGSQLVARALVAAGEQDTAGERWLDLCAGPGGKAALLAALAAGSGAHLTANEVAPHRAELVRQALRPVPRRAWTVRTGDGRDAAELLGGRPAAEAGFHRVLVDAPCTGLGALRRRPESRWRRTPRDLAELGPLQRELLRAALDVTRPGGLVAYATCSPHAAETLAVVQDVLAGRDDAELVDALGPARGAALPGALDGDRDPSRPWEGASGPATVQLWPHVHGTDAMFLALLRKH
ncbi:RsmB/NOP family class I SAM-dependent RNA methyltransferase [Kocuria rosea]|uniref:RsmB/NOP family class I SAM-dependent RNA methyltransferase n=1 Tax=Kocuria rosea TaxID=1275 RepID=UPI00203D8077|nr:transcription antitermination factor NusB [Kocuria rosea]MCM3687255.1 rRNA small subunit methyltransferase B [Kocuria rosea]HST73715.1 transcription antitermination factor NusB [Kocuria rosea]